MQLSDDQIVRILVAKYKLRGVDTSKLLSDPVFVALPLNSRISALKTYADQISGGINTKLNIDWKSSSPDIVMSGLGGVALAATLGNKLSLAGSAVSPRGLAAVAIAGGLLGTAGSALKVYSDNKAESAARQKIKDQLDSISRNPSDVQSVISASDLGQIHPDFNSPGRKYLNRIFQNAVEQKHDFARNIYHDFSNTSNS